jgi:parallel beta-helix repeat protein
MNHNKFKFLLIALIFIIIFKIHYYQKVKGFDYNDPVIYVDINGSSGFTNIQEAIDKATSGDVIFVKNGIYIENIVIDKEISLIGENNINTIIDGRSAGNTVKVNSNNVVIKNLTIQNSGIYFPNSGLNLSSNQNVVESNIIKNNLYGIIIYSSSDNLIRDNTIELNKNCGIYLSNSSNNLILNNNIMNHNFNGIGLYDQSNSNIIKYNSFFKNGYCGINIKISSMNEIISNNLSYNYIGIHVPDYENYIENNYFYNNNIDLDKELPTAGFELLFIIFSICILILMNKKKKN